MARRRRTPWHRIWRAAERGTGVYLSPEDILQLSYDDAIMFRGEGDAEEWGERIDDDGERDER